MLIANMRQRGVSLVELMVGMTVGLFVLLASTTVYLNSLRSSSDSIRANQLNQDLRAVMDIMVADIRRGGFWGNIQSGVANPFTSRSAGAATDINVSAGCILYSYDATYLPGGTVGNVDPGVDFFGFRLGDDAALQLLADNDLSDTASGCGDATWVNLTDPASLQITALTFDTVGSQCIAFDSSKFSSNFVPASFPGSNADAAWWAVTAGNDAACEEVPGGVAVPATADTRVEIRQINISLTAQSVQDASLARTVSESIVVRNNRVVGP